MVMAAGSIFGFFFFGVMPVPATASVRRVLVVMRRYESETSPGAERHGRGTEQGFFPVCHGVSLLLTAWCSIGMGLCPCFLINRAI
jgi:hypothetical protein